MTPIFLVSLIVRAQDPGVLPPDLDLLARIKARMVYNLKRQPNYTCVETVERSTRAKNSHKFQMVDTLRLEVALVDGKEMFAWPGSKNFSDADLRTMVTSGAISNGSFATHARAIFETRVATFNFRGDSELDGRKLVRFDYKVPKFLSGYHIKVGDAETVVAYHGAFYADPRTFDVQQIDVIADEIPLELNLSSASDTITYAMTRIGDADFLLPSESDLAMIDTNGQESRNHMRFSACRQFSGESVLTFADPPPDSAPGPSAVREIQLPPDLELRMKLANEIDLRTAAVGDPIKASLENDLRRKGETLIAKGATVIGRVVRVERHDSSMVLGIELVEIEGPGVHALIRATLENAVTGESSRPTRRTVLKTPPQPGEGLIEIHSGRVTVSRGSIMFWRT